MAVYTSVAISNAPGGGLILDQAKLQAEGPILQCAITLDEKRAEVLVRQGKAIPPQHLGRILIDTGASMTSIERTIFQTLGIPPVADCLVRTPSGSETQQVYPCSLAFPGTPLPVIKTIFVLGANLDGQGIVGLMGRDLLSQGVFVFAGSGGGFTLAF